MPTIAAMPAKSAPITSAAAQALIRQSGARLTSPRSAVLTLLLSADHALSHQEITDALAGKVPVDRVTVYRVLEWLTEQGLAHRIAGEDRVWRFSASRAEMAGAHQHAHFTCNRCGQTFCLPEIPAELTVAVPAGYRTETVELNLRGRCSHCK
jgi:Fur family transcriptional regulator, ferric uptake regulator